MLRRLVLAGLMVLGIGATGTAAHAGVSVNIGIDIPLPPHFVVVPGTAVSYAPAVPANYFFYGGGYYVFANGVWYGAPGYDGPWAVVAPAFVPPPLLTVPVGYYHVRPPQWNYWRHDVAPRWQENWAGFGPRGAKVGPAARSWGNKGSWGYTKVRGEDRQPKGPGGNGKGHGGHVKHESRHGNERW